MIVFHFKTFSGRALLDRSHLRPTTMSRSAPSPERILRYPLGYDSKPLSCRSYPYKVVARHLHSGRHLDILKADDCSRFDALHLSSSALLDTFDANHLSVVF